MMTEEKLKKITMQFHQDVVDGCIEHIEELERQITDIKESIAKVNERKHRSLKVLNNNK